MSKLFALASPHGARKLVTLLRERGERVYSRTILRFSAKHRGPRSLSRTCRTRAGERLISGARKRAERSSVKKNSFRSIVSFLVARWNWCSGTGSPSVMYESVSLLTSSNRAALPCGLFHLRPPRGHLHAPVILHDRRRAVSRSTVTDLPDRKSVPINSVVD